MMRIRVRLLLSAVIITLTAGLVTAQSRKLYPVDQAAKDPSFKLFRDKLLSAAQKKDREFVLSILDPKIQLSFGGESGIKDFKEMWKIDQPNSPFWNEMITILKMGGAFKTIDGRKEFVAPYVTSQWPDDPMLEPFEYVAVIGTNVRLRATPGVKAPIVASLSYDIVKLVNTQPPTAAVQKDGFKWVKVATGDGVEGFVADKYIRSEVDYRAYFRKVNGSWRLVVFIAGD
jgi:hypothetical protein